MRVAEPLRATVDVFVETFDLVVADLLRDDERTGASDIRGIKGDLIDAGLALDRNAIGVTHGTSDRAPEVE